MFKMVALILQGIVGFVLYLPARTATTHYAIHIGRGHGEIGHPAKMLDLAVPFDFPILDEIHQHVRVGFVQGNLIDESKLVSYGHLPR